MTIDLNQCKVSVRVGTNYFGFVGLVVVSYNIDLLGLIIGRSG